MKNLNTSLQPKLHQTVWVKNFEEIFKTLDDDNKLEDIPFMPEMMQFCGNSFRISCIPSKTCVEGYGLRNIADVVFLEDLRCDGAHHDGCQRECMLFWRKEWLSLECTYQKNPDIEKLKTNTNYKLETRKSERYFCQSTELHNATSNLPGGKFFTFIGDVFNQKLTLSKFIKISIHASFNRFNKLLSRDLLSRLRTHKMKTNSHALDLRPGEWIEVKSLKEIQTTLNPEGKNRGLLFESNMQSFCEHRYKVKNKLEKFILEETGKMVNIKNTVILDGGICQALNCPRANLLFWREIWLKRIH